ncbi:MAG: hypothetical protein BJ554DRAFT_4166, partial [Olpidium bornovanus]
LGPDGSRFGPENSRSIPPAPAALTTPPTLNSILSQESPLMHPQPSPPPLLPAHRCRRCRSNAARRRRCVDAAISASPHRRLSATVALGDPENQAALSPSPPSKSRCCSTPRRPLSAIRRAAGPPRRAAALRLLSLRRSGEPPPHFLLPPLAVRCRRHDPPHLPPQPHSAAPNGTLRPSQAGPDGSSAAAAVVRRSPHSAAPNETLTAPHRPGIFPVLRRSLHSAAP